MHGQMRRGLQQSGSRNVRNQEWSQSQTRISIKGAKEVPEWQAGSKVRSQIGVSNRGSGISRVNKLGKNTSFVHRIRSQAEGANDHSAMILNCVEL